MAYEIEKGVPVPDDAGSRGRLTKYPFREMEIGDSFAVDGTVQEGSIRRMTSKRGQELGRRFTCRRFGGGLRIWRIE